MQWPPTLADLKADLSITDSRDDEVLQTNLDAAVDFVQRVRSRFNYTADPMSCLPDPNLSRDLQLGTVRLAGRWFTRRRSPDGMLAMADLGAARVSSYDSDIDRMLRIGRYATAVVA